MKDYIENIDKQIAVLKELGNAAANLRAALTLIQRQQENGIYDIVNTEMFMDVVSDFCKYDVRTYETINSTLELAMRKARKSREELEK